MTRKCFLSGLVAAAAVVFGLQAKDIEELPVSAPLNRAYLTDMPERPWWNAAWRKRAPILLSNMANVRCAKVTADFVFDVDETINPGEVRVVTPWETVVPCVVEPARGRAAVKAVRILFQTDLRELENKPFFVYWDNPNAKAQPADSAFGLRVSDDTVYVNNGCLEVVFDNLHRTSGLIKTLKVNASQAPSELLWRTTGFAWEGFSFETDGKPAAKPDAGKVRNGNALDAQIHKPDAEGGWSKAIVTVDTALRKTITFTNEFASLDFTFYAGTPRVDYSYRLSPGLRRVQIGMAWACGGGLAHDDFFYPGFAGKTLTQRAALDWISDCEQPPMEYYNFPYFGKGWYAFQDRKSRDVVGMVFDRESFASPAYLAGANHCGETARMIFTHSPKADECATGRGALVATIGDYRDVEREYALLKDRPRVSVGQVQPYRDIKVRPVDLTRDFCVNYNCGGWKSAKPLAGDEWTENMLNHLRERGANTILLGQLTDYEWTDLPVPEDLYNRLCAYALKKMPKWKAPPRDGRNFTGERLRKICAAAHAKGMAVCTWHAGLPGIGHVFWSHPFEPEFWQLSAELQALYPKCGVDSVFCAQGGGEGSPLPEDLTRKFGREYWKWADPTQYFKVRQDLGRELKKFYEYSHRANPDAKVMIFNSDNGELSREMCMPYYPDCTDTLFCEFCAGDGDFSKIKHVAKRLRSYFDNRPGHTIHAHYYSMKLDHAERISQNEQPFVCGINAFSNEAMTYENTEPENSQFQADFYRFAQYTKLGAKVAKMAPVKNVAVLRDARCFEEDILRKRIRNWGWGYPVSIHDLRVNCFGNIRSFNYDIVMNPHFKVDSLKRYKVVYIPEDDVLSEELAKEALAFVKQGGGLVVEGATGDKVKEKGVGVEWKAKFDSGEVVEYGKGKIVWVKDVLTDRLAWRDAATCEKIKALVAAVGGQDPLAIESKSLDGVLQSGAEGFFLGVYNRGKESETGKASINSSTLQRFNSSTSLFVLDVKKGVRFAWTNGFEIAVGPRQCGYYLIGDDAFTAVPEVREALWLGAAASSTCPNGCKPLEVTAADFEPRQCVEFVTPAPRNYAGLPAEIQRSADARLVRHRFCAEESRMVEKAKTSDFDGWMAKNADGAKCYTRAAFARALKDASYVHFQCWATDCDDAFEDCAEELKALLKRGGGILFSRIRPGPKAQKFLKDVGVFDPTPSIKKDFQEPAVWSPNVSTNHPLRAKKSAAWFAGNIGASAKYTQWDKAKQIAPYVDAVQQDAALIVAQENVLGAGKVVFSLNRNSFTSWYENTVHGDAVLSYLLGMSVEEHAQKVRDRNGGPGLLVK